MIGFLFSLETTAAIVLAIIFAADAPTFDPVPVVQYGVLGLVLLMLLTGYLWAKPAVDEMRSRQDAERKLWHEEVIPAVKDLTAAVRALKNELEIVRRGGNADR